MGFDGKYLKEVIKTYALFFGREGRPVFEDLYAQKDFPRPKDPYLKTICLSSQPSQGSDKQQMWKKEDFPFLWPRISDLELFIRDTPADNFVKLLWRDRRDSYGWYTFV